MHNSWREAYIGVSCVVGKKKLFAKEMWRMLIVRTSYGIFPPFPSMLGKCAVKNDAPNSLLSSESGRIQHYICYLGEGNPNLKPPFWQMLLPHEILKRHPEHSFPCPVYHEFISQLCSPQGWTVWPVTSPWETAPWVAQPHKPVASKIKQRKNHWVYIPQVTLKCGSVL